MSGVNGSGGTGDGGSQNPGTGGGGAGGGGTGASAPTDWTSGLNDDLKGYVQNKGFKDPAMALDSYRNLEKLLGAPKERLLKLPEKDDDATGWGEVYGRLGRPAKPEDYGLKAPEKDGDPAFVDWAKKTFHAQNLTTKQAQALVNEFNSHVTSVKQAQEAKLNVELQAQDIALRGEWGAAYDQNAAIVDKAAEAFGIDDKQLKALRDAMGGAGAMKFLYTIGSKLGEGDFVTGGKSGGMGQGVLSPSAARERISSLQGDAEFRKKLLNGDLTAKKEWDNLHMWMVS